MPNDDQLEPELAALLQRGAPRPTLPDDVSARLLRRAATTTVVTTGLLASLSASAKVGLLSAVVAVAAAGGIWGASQRAAPLTTTMPTMPKTTMPTSPTSAPGPVADAPTAQPALVVVEPPPEPAPAATSTAGGPVARRVVVDEVQLLEQARVAIGEGRLADAEAALHQHRRQHPRVSLSEEREALMVVTLARRGEMTRAQQAAAAFHRRFAHSAFAALVDAAASP